MGRRRLVGGQTPPSAYRIRGVSEERNFPARDKLNTALKKRGIRFTDAEIDPVVEKPGARQFYAPKHVYSGNMASHAPDARWGRGEG